MLIAILIVLNIPVYLLLGWVVFDNKDNAATSIFETVVSLLRIILVPPIVRVLLGWDDTDAIGILPLAAYLFTCGLIVYGEHRLLHYYLGWQ